LASLFKIKKGSPLYQLGLGIFLLALAGIFAWYGQQLATEGIKNWNADKNIFRVNPLVLVTLKYPGPLLFCYNSALGKTISPVSMALYLEVSNAKQTISRIESYKAKALFVYDEGGQNQITELPDGSRKFNYIPSGKIVEKWRQLHSLGFLHDQIYFILNNDFAKAKRLDFQSNSFDLLARNTQLKAGESIMGWIFLEVDSDLRCQLPIIKQFEITLRNSSGESQTFQFSPPKFDDVESEISSGDWHLLEGYYDLTKEEYTICPQLDLRKMFKKK
jgi:hypothetical protein